MSASEPLALAVHGGAGNIRRGRDDEAPMREELAACLADGERRLRSGEPAVDVVEAVVRRLEAHPLFNAGLGAVLTSSGDVELDASIMDGRDRAAGAVGGLRGFLHPISVARRVMDQGDHVLLVGEGAAAFARACGFEATPDRALVTDARRRQLERARERARIQRDHDDVAEPAPSRGTVGAVARDCDGHLAAATSTGGLANQRPGRVGDSAVIGAGTWADDATCAVSTTGHGEAFIRAAVAHEVDAALRRSGCDLETAAREALRRAADCGGTGGLIAVDAAGRIAMPLTAPGMFRGSITSDAVARVCVFGDE